MCFLKTLKPLQEMSYSKEPSSDQSSQVEVSKDTQDQGSFLNQLLISRSPFPLGKKDQLLLGLMDLVKANNSYLNNLGQKLSINQQLLKQAHLDLDSLHALPSPTLTALETSSQLNGQSHQQSQENSTNPLIGQLFGKKKYQYRLQLQKELPTTIFKERNINISVNLTNLNGEKILNSNIIHLCLGICDANGQWISENRAGETFMKGKTEVELYHGEGAFLKVYPRDVSRSYPDGKLNFVVYSKPSMLKFSSNASVVQQIVDSELIEPMLIKDISIKAKKKD